MNAVSKEESKVILYPPEFVSMIADLAIGTLHDWLQKNNLPEEVISMADQVVMLERYTQQLENGKVYETDMEELHRNLPHILEIIMRLGGTFSNDYLQGVRRENVIKLRPG